MKLRELFLDYVISTRLFEMAKSRADCLDKIDAIGPQLARHIIKYLAFDDPAKQHWIHEINVFLGIISDLRTKPKNKPLNYNDYYKYLWIDPIEFEEQIGIIIRGLITFDYVRCRRSELTDVEIFDMMFNIYKEICMDASLGKLRNIQYYFEPR